MCDPISFASIAIGAASQVTSFMGATQQANEQNQLAENNRIESNRAAADQYAQIQDRLRQERAAADQQLEAGNVQAASQRSSARVSAGESGVTGLSIDSILADSFADQGKFERTTAQNLAMTRDQLAAQEAGIKADTSQRINSVQKVAKPSFAPFAIGIASGALDAYSDSVKRKIK